MADNTPLALPAAFHKPGALAPNNPAWDVKAPSEFAAGIRRGFAVVSLRGKVWRIVHQGVERAVMRPDSPHEPASSIDVVFIRSGGDLSKVYYDSGYVEGNDSAPTCFSNNGIKPDASVAAPQSSVCAICPNNVWGSKITENGKPTKACSDSKRLAILPLPAAGVEGDAALDTLDNEVYGGPMLLRLPAASLADLATFDSQMRGMGYPLYALGANLSFDINQAFPKVVFRPVRPLTQDEYEVVMEHRESQQAIDIVGGLLPAAESAPAQAAIAAPTPPPSPPPAPTPAPPPPPPPPPPPLVQAPVQAPVAAPVAAVAAPAGRRARRASAEPTLAAPPAQAAPVAQAPVQAAPAAPVADPAAGSLEDVLAQVLGG